MAFLNGLRAMLAAHPPEMPAMIVGDFNQRVPRHAQPLAVYEALVAAMSGFEIVTGRVLDGAPGPSIDHVAVSRHWRASRATYLDQHDNSG